MTRCLAVTPDSIGLTCATRGTTESISSVTSVTRSTSDKGGADGDTTITWSTQTGTSTLKFII